MLPSCLCTGSKQAYRQLKKKNCQPAQFDWIKLESKAQVEPRVFGRAKAWFSLGQKKLEPFLLELSLRVSLTRFIDILTVNMTCQFTCISIRFQWGNYDLIRTQHTIFIFKTDEPILDTSGLPKPYTLISQNKFLGRTTKLCKYYSLLVKFCGCF